MRKRLIAYIVAIILGFREAAAQIYLFLSEFPGLSSPLKEEELDEILQAGGGIDLDNERLLKPICVKSVTVWRTSTVGPQPVFLNVYSTNNNNSVRGIAYYYGDIDLGDHMPMWVGAL